MSLYQESTYKKIPYSKSAEEYIIYDTIMTDILPTQVIQYYNAN